MKSFVKRILILVGLFCVTLFLMYKSELKRIFIKDKIYIVFDVQKDSCLPVDWDEYASLFPENFNPMLIREIVLNCLNIMINKDLNLIALTMFFSNIQEKQFKRKMALKNIVLV